MDNKKKGSYALNSTYPHNNKITSYYIQQESDKSSQRRNAKHHDGQYAAITEMLHVILRYPEVYINLIIVSICTIPL